MLEITRDATKQQYHRHLRKIKEIEEDIEKKVTKEDIALIQTTTNKSKENKFKKESQRLKAKFEVLHESNKHQERKAKQKIQQEVHDMTKDGIDADVKSYLSLGPDFSETPKRFPYEKIIIETESMCKVIED